MNTQDRLDIKQKIAEYSYTLDGKDAEGWANLFTEDGVWDCIVKGQETPIEHLVGRDAIREWGANLHKRIPDTYRSFHHQSGTTFDELTPDAAITRTMLIITGQDMTATDPAEAGVKVTTAGVYHDRWKKTSEGWLIAERVLVL